ncbi:MULTISPECIES: hypothetical protein [Bacillus]|nr:hypothetical protein [Bacillus glycinifermentans]MBU8786117.1 hypothetical protein [Bacillus glycinifermentans]
MTFASAGFESFGHHLAKTFSFEAVFHMDVSMPDAFFTLNHHSNKI